jgi:dolichyl-phosphate beta-glucosyltransferase
MTKDTTCLVVPCFNEQNRLDEEKYEELVGTGLFSLLFVDDCSTDKSVSILNSYVDRWPQHVTVVHHTKNLGKGEAVRSGLLAGIAFGHSQIAFMDADFAIPPAEVMRFVQEAKRFPDKSIFLGSRVQLLGSNIDRTFMRHLSGRLFATVASIVTKTKIYDSQCGLKLFVVNDQLKASLSKEFRTRWLFDLEIIQRLKTQTEGTDGSNWIEENAVEIPLREWNEVPGTKFSFVAQLKSMVQLILVTKP